MIKHFGIGILLIVFLGACSKDDLGTIDSSLKLVPNTQNHLARRLIHHSNGNTYIFSIGAEDASQVGPYGNFPALISVFDSQANFVSTSPLPASVYELWNAIELENGNMLVIGRDDNRSSNQIGLIVLSPSGDLLHEHSFQNNNTAASSFIANGAFSGNSMDCIQLDDGSIVLGCLIQLSQFEFRRMRLLKFDTQLNLLDDVNSFIQFQDTVLPPGQLSLKAQMMGRFTALMFNPQFLRTGDTLNLATATSLLISSQLDILEKGHFKADEFGIPRGHSFADPDEMVWTFTPENPRDITYQPTLNLRNQERYSYGPKIDVFKSNFSGEILRRTELSGFPNNGIVQSIQKCLDGGFILVGTVNLNLDSSVPSFQSIYMARLDAELNVQWTQDYNFNQPTYGVHIAETETGFSICATTYSNQNIAQVILIKTDNQGQLI